MTNNHTIINLKSLDGALREEILVLKEQVEKFCKREISPIAEKIDETNVFPNELWKKLGALGVLGVTVPDEFGGLGLGYLEHALIMEEISTYSASIGLSYGAHSNLCVNQVNLNGSREQKEKYLPRLVSGDYVGALAMSETEAGSDVVSMKLKADKSKGGFILNGRKMWITNGPEADVLVVYTKTEPELSSKGITAFLIEKNFKGFSTAQKLNKLGMRGSNTCELIFEDCFVPKENILGELNQGVKVLMSGLDYERVVLAAGPLGIMKACLNLVLPYVRERKQFGKPIGEFELIQGKLADMYTSYIASRSLVHNVANACDRGESARKDAAAAILFAAECGTKAGLDAVQILGGNGYTNDYPAGRYLRDAKLYEIGAGTSEIRRMLIGRELFHSK